MYLSYVFGLHCEDALYFIHRCFRWEQQILFVIVRWQETSEHLVMIFMLNQWSFYHINWNQSCLGMLFPVNWMSLLHSKCHQEILHSCTHSLLPWSDHCSLVHISNQADLFVSKPAYSSAKGTPSSVHSFWNATRCWAHCVCWCQQVDNNNDA